MIVGVLVAVLGATVLATGQHRRRLRGIVGSRTGQIIRRWRIGRRQDTDTAPGQDTAAYLGRVAAGLRSGLPPAEAFMRADIQQIGWAEDLGAATAAGTGAGQAVRQLADGRPATRSASRMHPQGSSGGMDERVMLTALAAAIDVTEHVGTPLADVLDRLSLTLDDIADADGDRNAAVAGPAASARLLGWLPLVGVGLGELIGANPIGVLVDGGAGTAVGLAGLAMMWVGRRWSMRLVQRASGQELPRSRRLRPPLALGPRRRLVVTVPEPNPPSPPDVLVVVDLIAAVLLAGGSVPQALHVVGSACAGPMGEDLCRTADRLTDEPWLAAWRGTVTRWPELRWVSEALAISWHMGASSAPQLRRVHARIARHRRAEAKVAAGRLAVQLVLPLGLCLLPAFFLLGLAPLAMSLIGQFLGSGIG